jgi:heme-degrading monooxygenase HmoA
MIARLWRGATTPENANEYEAHIRQNVFPALPGIAGHRGAFLLKREAEGSAEFLALTLWDSMDAIREFAGSDVDVAVVEPRAQAVLKEYDGTVRHYEVVLGTDS